MDRSVRLALKTSQDVRSQAEPADTAREFTTALN